MSLWNVTGSTNKLNFKFFISLVNLKSPMWPSSTILDREALELQFSSLTYHSLPWINILLLLIKFKRLSTIYFYLLPLHLLWYGFLIFYFCICCYYFALHVSKFCGRKFPSNIISLQPEEFPLVFLRSAGAGLQFYCVGLLVINLPAFVCLKISLFCVRYGRVLSLGVAS